TDAAADFGGEQGGSETTIPAAGGHPAGGPGAPESTAAAGTIVPLMDRVRIDTVAAVRGAALGAGSPAGEGATRRERPTVPDSLRDTGRRRLAPLAAALVAGFWLTAGAMLVVDQMFGVGRLLGLADVPADDAPVQTIPGTVDPSPQRETAPGAPADEDLVGD